MTAQQIANLNLGLALDAKTVITVNAALEWIRDNTTINIKDTANIPACAKLFILKFNEISNLRVGVTSESIEGLSQSFRTDNTSALIWDAAHELLGSYIVSQVRYVQAKPRWNNTMQDYKRACAKRDNEALENRLDGVDLHEGETDRISGELGKRLNGAD